MEFSHKFVPPDPTDLDPHCISVNGPARAIHYQCASCMGCLYTGVAMTHISQVHLGTIHEH